MNILIPVICFGRSGGFRVLSKLADEMIYLGHNVYFLCPDGSELPYFSTKAVIKWVDKNGNINAINNFHLNKKETFFTIQQKLYRGLKNIPAQSYDIILANHFLTILPIFRCKLINKTVYYVQAYEPEYYYILAGWKNKVLGLLAEYIYTCNIYTVVNADVYKKYKKLKSNKVLYPGIDFSIFYPQSDFLLAEKLKKEVIIIGTIGRLESYKGTKYVLEGYKLIKEKYKNVQLHVAFGNPDDFVDVENVYCFTPSGDKALGDYYRSLDYYCCAGFVQLGAFHYPIVEAMCCGIPVITTKYYPINNENAWVINPFDATTILEQFEMANTNPKLTIEKKLKALNDTKHLDWKNSGLKLDGFLKEKLLE